MSARVRFDLRTDFECLRTSASRARARAAQRPTTRAHPRPPPLPALSHERHRHGVRPRQHDLLAGRPPLPGACPRAAPRRCAPVACHARIYARTGSESSRRGCPREDLRRCALLTPARVRVLLPLPPPAQVEYASKAVDNSRCVMRSGGSVATARHSARAAARVRLLTRAALNSPRCALRCCHHRDLLLVARRWAFAAKMVWCLVCRRRS